ncbi:MAG: cation-transporting P-type ATPase [Hyphomonadaceae bacterium]|nr:cation-transporting P-type ATPase [Hyphomonadaceae bacterium]
MSSTAGAAAEAATEARLEPQAQVHHALSGRTRMRLPPLKGQADLLSALARRLAARPGIRSVHENTWAGSLLIEHDKALTSHAISEMVLELWRSGLTRPTRVAPDAGKIEDWHALPAPMVAAALGSRAGLSHAEANTRLSRIGENRLPEPTPASLPRLVLEQVQSAPVALLGASAVLSLATGGVLDAVVTLGVIAINAGIGVSTESWTANLIRRLGRPTDPDIVVLRDGEETHIPSSRVAPGDWLVLKAGMPVVADARLVKSDALALDESALTGESLPVEKDASVLAPPATPLGERRNMVFRGSVVTTGAGFAVVTATGGGTELGRVSALLHRSHAPRPPMERALDKLGLRLTIACIGASAAVALLLKLRGAPWIAVSKSAIALAVSAIPEGLPALATSTKALAARAMAREGAFVRNVNVLETAANIDVLCLDKTGTLTQNRMQAAVAHTLQDLHEFTVPNDMPPSPALRRLAEVAALCNDADDVTQQGSGTELALLAGARLLGGDVERLRRTRRRTGTLSRSNTRLYMATEHKVRGGAFLAVKGAPAHVLALCTHVREGKELRTLDEATRADIAAQNEALASQGLRVLGFARGVGRTLGDGDPAELEWLGLIGLNDPVRPEAPAAVRLFRDAGLRRVILTGDQAATARKLAADLGLGQDGSLDVVDATEIRGLPQKELAALARRCEVFARVSPTDKLAIIRALQSEGHVVAMTGDGVNDGPALRAADVGIAMGKTGTDVARDVADIVIADDDLHGLATALARGRAADENLRRAVRYLLSTNGSEVALVLAEALQGPDAIESPAELFWLNLMTDIFPGMGLAMAAPAPDILRRPPRPARDDVFGGPELSVIAQDALRIALPAVITHFISHARFGAGPDTRGRTFLALAAHQLVHALRLSPGARPGAAHFDRPVELGAGAGAVLLAAPFLLPRLRRMLKIARPSLPEMMLISGFAVFSLLLSRGGRA